MKVLNQESVDKESILGEYMEFVFRLRKNRAVCKNLEAAIAETVSTCMKDGILSEYLMSRKGEIFNMLAEEMRVEDLIGTAEQNMKTGIKIGREEGIKEGSVLTLYELDYSIDDIMARTKLSKDEINQIIFTRYH